MIFGPPENLMNNDDDDHTKDMEMGSSNVCVVLWEVSRHLATIQPAVITRVNNNIINIIIKNINITKIVVIVDAFISSLSPF